MNTFLFIDYRYKERNLKFCIYLFFAYQNCKWALNINEKRKTGLDVNIDCQSHKLMVRWSLLMILLHSQLVMSHALYTQLFDSHLTNTCIVASYTCCETWVQVVIDSLHSCEQDLEICFNSLGSIFFFFFKLLEGVNKKRKWIEMIVWLATWCASIANYSYHMSYY